MPRKMRLDDFRARRTVLLRSDYAFAPGPQKRPRKDLIAEKTWEGIQILPDTVAILTSNGHGSDLALLSDLWGSWVETLEIDSALTSKGAVHHASLLATDEFQGATFNALHGFYRLVANSLRSTLEQMTIATDLELRGNDAEIQLWLDGSQEFRFGSSCDNLQKAFSQLKLRRLFQQDDGKTSQGWIRSFHSSLSNFSHGRPGFDSVELWEGSNGPIYVRAAFLWSVRMWMFTYAISVILLKLTRPDLEKVGEIFSRPQINDAKALRDLAELLWPLGSSSAKSE
jgi:hypothetical protein